MLHDLQCPVGVVAADGKGEVGGITHGGVLYDDVHADVGVGEWFEEACRDAWTVDDSGDRDLGDVAVGGDGARPVANLPYPRSHVGPLVNERSRRIDEAGRYHDWHVVLHGKLD